MATNGDGKMASQPAETPAPPAQAQSCIAASRALTRVVLKRFASTLTLYAEASTKRVKIHEDVHHLSLFSIRLASLDADGQRYVRIKRAEVMRQLLEGTGDTDDSSEHSHNGEDDSERVPDDNATSEIPVESAASAA